MTATSHVLVGAEITGRGASLNPFVVVPGAARFIDFVTAVFGVEEVAEARTATPDGILIHAEVRMGDSVLLIADPQEGWPALPGLLQVWVADAAAVLAAGQSHGATTVTPPTPFYGSLRLARMQDPWDNLWWLYQPAPGQADPRPVWEGGPDTIFRTIDEHMRGRRDR